MEAALRVPTHDLVPKIFATYGVTADNDSERSRFVDKHIETLEESENEAIARSGFVLKRAKEGFGLGYKVPVAVIAMGQAMLGIDLAVATPFLASNPAAFTAAALGAVYFGYSALDDDERAELHQRVGEALNFGVELVKTIARYIIDTMKSLLDPQNLAQIKEYVAETAESVGSSLYEVTGKLVDKVTDLAMGARSVVGSAGEVVNKTASDVFRKGQKMLWHSEEDAKK